MNEEADIVTIVSSDLIATVMEDYFNKKMYRQPVHIVELKPTETGYSFFLQFAQKEQTTVTKETISKVPNIFDTLNGQKKRDNKGKFVKKEMTYEHS